MIAKPNMPESLLREVLDDLDGRAKAGKIRDLTDRDIWLDQRQALIKQLDDWQAWRKQERRLRALHQRPSVRRYITRRVKMPA